MLFLLDHPFSIFIFTIITCAASVWFGNAALSKYRTKDSETAQDLGIIQTATLTLLALIIGFTFSMAIDRHDQRELLEAAEANAISTEYLRSDLLQSPTDINVKITLRSYLDQRIEFYSWQDKETAKELTLRTNQSKTTLWNEIIPVAQQNSNAVIRLITAGMNDVFNAQGNTEAVWQNRIPYPAWALMGAIAICANLIVGFGARNFSHNIALFMMFPFVIAVSFFLIADIDSPRSGVIKIEARNLILLKETLNQGKVLQQPR
jgi:hypothetical protein